MTVRTMTEQDRDQVRAIRIQAFNQPVEYRDLNDSTPLEIQRVWERDGRVQAAAASRPFGHYFGGRSVPAAGITGVVVLPEARGRGAATDLVTTMLREARPDYPVASLFPATLPVYRKAGFEIALYQTIYAAPVDALPRVRDALAMQPWGDGDLEQVAEAYRRYAQTQNGLLDRPLGWWDERVLRPLGSDPVYRYLVREGGRITGWVVFTQSDAFDVRLRFRDLVATTPAAAQAILTFASAHHSLGKEIFWFGPPVDPFAMLLDEERIRIDARNAVMLRVLDVPAAIAARGYRGDIAHRISLTVVDPLFPGNNGPWQIDIDAGIGSVKPVDNSEITLPIGVFSAIYTGFLRPSEARMIGLLEASDDEIRRLEGIFDGPTPWIIDHF